jgi:Ribonuclease G/E
MRIDRFDAKFPKHVANAVSEAIGRMLVETRPRKKGGSIILDGTEIEFSVEKRSGRSIRGLLTPYAKGKNGTGLRQLTELLRLYCESKATFRSEVARKIEVQARLLIK